MLHIGAQRYVMRERIIYVGNIDKDLLVGRNVINVCKEGKEPKSMILTDDNSAFLTFLSSWSVVRRLGGNENEEN